MIPCLAANYNGRLRRRESELHMETGRFLGGMISEVGGNVVHVDVGSPMSIRVDGRPTPKSVEAGRRGPVGVFSRLHRFSLVFDAHSKATIVQEPGKHDGADDAERGLPDGHCGAE